MVYTVSDGFAEELNHLLRTEKDPKLIRRLTGVQLAVINQVPTNRVADILQCTEASVRRWINHAIADGLESLQSKPIPGHASKLSQEQKEALKEILGPTRNNMGTAFGVAKQFNPLF